MPPLSSGALCLDFANSASSRAEPQPHEHLHRYGDLTRWGRHAEVLSDDVAAALLRRAGEDEPGARAAFEAAIEFREAIYRVFYALGEHEPLAEADLARLERAYLHALGRATLAPDGGAFAWAWSAEQMASSLDSVTWPIAKSAVDLLTSEAVGRIKVCAGESCRWLLLDTTKNGIRRWCSMQDCGSSEKARRQAARRRAARQRARR